MKTFVSYAWDGDSHKAWVAKLATRLRADGVETRLDQWHAVPGDQLPQFMEREIRDNSYVVIICTPKYKQKSDSRSGGVGYEGDVMTAEVLTTNNHRKFIPVLASGVWSQSAPTWLAGKYFVDLSDEAKFEQNYKDLLNTILGTRPEAPKIGMTPAIRAVLPQGQPVVETPKLSEDVRILGVIVDEVTEPPMDGTIGCALYTVPFSLSRRPSSEWIQLFLQAWEFPTRFTSMHRPGIAEVAGNRIVLRGTTIDEVQRHHKETLSLCVNQANEREALWRLKVETEQALERQQTVAHRKNVQDIASKIRFS